MVEKLFGVYMKIREDGQEEYNRDLLDIIHACLTKSIRRNYNKPIDRVIAELCGIIQSNTVNENDVARYKL